MVESSIDTKKESLVDVSVIIPCKNEVNTLKLTVDSIIESQNFCNFEVIVVDDRSLDSSTDFLNADLNKPIYKKIKLIKTDNVGAAKARNTGAEIAKGKYLFFCDAHIKVQDRWLDHLVYTLKNSDADLVTPCIIDMNNILAEGYGQTWDDKLKIKWLTQNPNDIKEIPIAGGCALGIVKDVFERIDGFNKFFQVWGREDEELCFRSWLYGYKIVVNPDVRVKHLFRKKHPYEVTTANVIYNTLCFAYFHFGKERLRKIIEILKDNIYFQLAADEIKFKSELILAEREKCFNERMYNDDFFFKKFMIPF